MPQGDVRLHELAEAVRDRIETEVSYLSGSVDVIDRDPDSEPENARRGLGTKPYGVRIGYADPAIVQVPAFNSTVDFEFRLAVVVLYRRMGSMKRRAPDVRERDITKITKDVMNALTGERLDLLNRGGLQCGPARFESDESALRSMAFLVTGNSRETRS